MPPELLTRARVALAMARGHRTGPAAAILAAAGALHLLGPATIPLPAVFSLVDVRTTLAVLASLGFAIAATQLTSEPAAAQAATSPRGWIRLRLIRLTAGTALITVVAAVTAPPDAALVAAAATLVLTAEGLLAARMLGTGLAWSLPFAHLAAALIFGTTSQGAAQPWAWFIDPLASSIELIAALLIATMGLAAWAIAPVDFRDETA